MKKGDEIVVDIEQFADRGKSIARVDGYVVFVPHAVPGDRVRIALTRRRKKFGEGKIVEVIERSAHRTEPICRYFGTCGGCKWQNVDYAAQLEAKRESVLSAFQHHGGFVDIDVPTVLAADDPYGYRNKMEFSFSASRWLTDWEIASGDRMRRDFALGLHVPGRFDKVLDISECHLIDSSAVEIVNTVRDLAIEHEWQPWHIRDHTGYLRHLVLRHAHYTGQTMINLVTSAALFERTEVLVKVLVDRFPHLTTIVNMIHSGPAQAAIGERVDVLYGPGSITEKMGRFEFEVGPTTFFQTNTRQAEVLYDVALDFAQLAPHEHVYDLYCGCGTISLFAAEKVASVTGVELVPEAVAAARENASRNGVTNCSFVAGDMLKTFTDEFFSKHGRPDVVIVDPPRAGMHPKVADRLSKLGADRIVYVSCNPLSQARDLAVLNTYYSIERIQPVDLFPQTHHIENVVLLKSREVA